MKYFCLIQILWLYTSIAAGWQEEFSRMPVRDPIVTMRAEQPVRIIFESFKSNRVVKCIVLMPGAADELYFHDREPINLSGSAPTLLNLIQAIEGVTAIRAVFTNQFLLLATPRDRYPAKLSGLAEHEFLKKALPGRIQFLDRSWENFGNEVEDLLGVKASPARTRTDWYHFYRFSFAGYDLSGAQLLEAAALTGKLRGKAMATGISLEYDDSQFESASSR